MTTPAVRSPSSTLAEKLAARIIARDPADLIDLCTDEDLVGHDGECLVRRLATLVRALPLPTIAWLTGEGSDELPVAPFRAPAPIRGDLCPEHPIEVVAGLVRCSTCGYVGTGAGFTPAPRGHRGDDYLATKPSSDEPAHPPPVETSDSRRAERSKSAAPSSSEVSEADLVGLLDKGPLTIPQMASHFGVAVEVICRVLEPMLEEGRKNHFVAHVELYRGDGPSALYRSSCWHPKGETLHTVDLEEVRGALTTQPQTAHEIAKWLTASKDAVNVILRELVAAGEAVKSGTGKGVKFAASDALLAQRDAAKLAKSEPPPEATTKKTRAKGPPLPVPVTHGQVQQVFDALTDRKGGHMRGGEAFYLKSVAAIVEATKLPEGHVRRALEILKGNGRAFEQEGMFFRDSGPVADEDEDEDEREEDEATAPTDPPPPPVAARRQVTLDEAVAP